MVKFNIVHLTDLHFGGMPKRPNILSKARHKLPSVWNGTWLLPPTHDPKIASSLASWLYQKAAALAATGDQLDAIVLSGDLATTGMQTDLEAALRYIDTAPASTYFRSPARGQHAADDDLATIAGLAAHYLVVPGNHDRFENNNCDAGGTHFDSVFAKYWSGSKTRGVTGKIIEKATSQAAGSSLERLAIFCVDGCLRDPAHAKPKLAQKSQGAVYRETAIELKTRTEAARQMFPDISVIWVIHFPPHYSIPPREAMRHYFHIEQASRSLNVDVILSGHTHVNFVYPADRASLIWNGGSATQFAEGHGNWIQLLDIDVAKNQIQQASRYNYRYLPKTDDFALDSVDRM
ncbi:metallophosphoesterase family protein [Bradyrhizobium diazoefficiens]